MAFLPMITKYSFIIPIIALLLSCFQLQASSSYEGNSHIAETLESYKDAKKLDGAKMKIARPFIKKTPMGAMLDQIEMMIICPMERHSNNKAVLTENSALEILADYDLVKKIDDERSAMSIYIDKPKDNRFSEIILYNTRPESSVMLFVGDFTVESLIRVGEISDQQRKNVKKNK